MRGDKGRKEEGINVRALALKEPSLGRLGRKEAWNKHELSPHLGSRSESL